MQELKPLDLAGLLDKTFKLAFTKNTLKVAGSTFGVLLAGMLLLGLYFFYIFRNTLLDITEAKILSNLITVIPASIIGLLFIVGVYLYYFSLLTDLYGNTFLEKEWSFKDSIKRVSKKIGSIIINSIIVFIFYCVIGLFLVGAILIVTGSISTGNKGIITASFIFIIILYLLMFMVFIFLILCHPAIILEDKDGINSIKRSIKLVKYNFWRVLGSYYVFSALIIFIFYIALIIISIIAVIFIFIFAAIFQFNFNNSNNSTYMIYVILGVIYAIMVMLMHFIYSSSVGFVTVLFYNQKIKNENFGVELLAESMITENKESLQETELDKNEIQQVNDTGIENAINQEELKNENMIIQSDEMNIRNESVNIQDDNKSSELNNKTPENNSDLGNKESGENGESNPNQ